MIFLDNNSTTQIDPRVLKEIIPYFNQKYGNPSSNSHEFGWEANDAIDISRKKISNLINSEPNEIIFTSGVSYGSFRFVKSVSKFGSIVDFSKILDALA